MSRLKDVVAYDDLLKHLLPPGPRDILIGNGFSIAAFSPFGYSSLTRKVRDELPAHDPDLRALLDDLDIVDLEDVMESIRAGAGIEDPTDLPPEDVETIGADQYQVFQQAFISAVARTHPARLGFLDGHNWESCHTFLVEYRHVFTLNYDLLLYWANMKSRDRQRWQDGFHADSEGCLRFAPPYRPNDPTLVYLHGGLHLYEQDDLTQKLRWQGPGESIIDQLREGLETGQFPLFVAEGSAAAKQDRIGANEYLAWGLSRLRQCDGNLVSFGVSFGASDDHIMEALAEAEGLRSFSIGAYSATRMTAYSALLDRITMARRDRGQDPIPTFIFDSRKVRPWGKHGVPKQWDAKPTKRYDWTAPPELAPEDPRYNPEHEDYDPDWAR